MARICPKCGAEKEPGRKDSYCRECRRQCSQDWNMMHRRRRVAMNKKWNEAHPDLIKKYHREYQARLREPIDQ